MFRSRIHSALQKAKIANQFSKKIGSHSYNQRFGTLINAKVLKGWGGFGKNYSTKSNSGVITCKGAVCWGQGEPVRVEEIHVEPPRSTEVRLKMSYASLCHTDILCSHGIFGPIFPRVLGHEGVGVVESVGDQVTEFKEGDVVIPTFLGECHVCENCISGKTNVCPTYPMPLSGLMPDGTSRMFSARSSTNERLYHLFSCSTWAEYTVIDVNYAVKVKDTKLPLPHASLLSCGFSTGYGAPWKDAKVEKGSSVAVIGLGAVGLGAVEGARLQEASRIIGIDKNIRKGAKGKAFGMTEFINPGDKPISDLVKELTGGLGVDYCIECTGALPLAQQALESTKAGTGTTILIGAGSKPSTEIVYNTILMGRTLKGSVFGGIKVKSELPILMDSCVSKGIRLDELVTHEISLDDIGKAFDLLKEPDCVKVLIKI